MADRGERLVHAFHADPVVPDLAGRHQIIEDAVDAGVAEHRRGRTVKLQQIDGLHFEVAQASIDPVREVRAAVAVRRLRRQAPARLRRHVDRLAGAFPPQPRYQALAAAIAVDVCRVDEIHAAVDRGVERPHRLLVVHRAPGAADGPGAKTDRRHGETRAAQHPIFHSTTPCLNGE
jgi:predicted transcriptional regulator